MRSAITRLAAAASLVGLLSSGPAFGAGGDAVAEATEKRMPETRLVGVVNVNTATPEELELLPGIGPARARAIVEDRKANGPYAKADDLVRVSGIGEHALERIRPHLVVKGKTTAQLGE